MIHKYKNVFQIAAGSLILSGSLTGVWLIIGETVALWPLSFAGMCVTAIFCYFYGAANRSLCAAAIAIPLILWAELMTCPGDCGTAGIILPAWNFLPWMGIVAYAAAAFLELSGKDVNRFFASVIGGASISFILFSVLIDRPCPACFAAHGAMLAAAAYRRPGPVLFGLAGGAVLSLLLWAASAPLPESAESSNQFDETIHNELHEPLLEEGHGAEPKPEVISEEPAAQGTEIKKPDPEENASTVIEDVSPPEAVSETEAPLEIPAITTTDVKDQGDEVEQQELPAQPEGAVVDNENDPDAVVEDEKTDTAVEIEKEAVGINEEKLNEIEKETVQKETVQKDEKQQALPVVTLHLLLDPDCGRCAEVAGAFEQILMDKVRGGALTLKVYLVYKSDLAQAKVTAIYAAEMSSAHAALPAYVALTKLEKSQRSVAGILDALQPLVDKKTVLKIIKEQKMAITQQIQQADALVKEKHIHRMPAWWVESADATLSEPRHDVPESEELTDLLGLKKQE